MSTYPSLAMKLRLAALLGGTFIAAAALAPASIAATRAGDVTLTAQGGTTVDDHGNDPVQATGSLSDDGGETKGQDASGADDHGNDDHGGSSQDSGSSGSGSGSGSSGSGGGSSGESHDSGHDGGSGNDHGGHDGGHDD